MRLIATSLLVFAMTAGVALAEDTSAPLAPGKPAGVHAAQMGDNTLLIAVGAGAFIAAVAVLATDSGNNNITNATAPVTTSTGTAG